MKKKKNIKKPKLSTGLIKALKKLYQGIGIVPFYQISKLVEKGYWDYGITEKGKIFLDIEKKPNSFLQKKIEIPSRFANRVKQFVTGTGGW